MYRGKFTNYKPHKIPYVAMCFEVVKFCKVTTVAYTNLMPFATFQVATILPSSYL